MSASTDSLKAALAPAITSDFGLYIDGLVQLVSEIETLIRDTDDGKPGWSSIVDLDRATTDGLSWLAQFVGVVARDGLSDSAQRSWIRAQAGQSRGTLQSIIAAAQLSLTGTKQVIVRERFGGAYNLTIITRTSETPNSAQTLADILTQKPAGIILTYTVLTGQDYQILFTNKATYQAVFTGYVTYEGVASDQAGV